MLLFGLLACGSAPSAPRDGAEAGAETLRRVRALAAAPCDADSQCQTLAMGAKSCGGPEWYLAWSTASGEAAQVRALAARYTAWRKAQDASSGALSDCRVVPDPGASCQAGASVLGAAKHCVLRAAGAGAD
ncbi:MAG TPA: hypothetical protein DCW29_24140 [Janthinobacterium sp.]|nr:hypothetical protein [Janthinobacterium sp.]